MQKRDSQTVRCNTLLGSIYNRDQTWLTPRDINPKPKLRAEDINCQNSHYFQDSMILKLEMLGAIINTEVSTSTKRIAEAYENQLLTTQMPTKTLKLWLELHTDNSKCDISRFYIPALACSTKKSDYRGSKIDARKMKQRSNGA